MEGIRQSAGRADGGEPGGTETPVEDVTGNPANAIPTSKAADFLERVNDAFRADSGEEQTVDLGMQPDPETD
jgi:hypothetical protein